MGFSSHRSSYFYEDVVNLVDTQLSGTIPSELCELYNTQNNLHAQVDCEMCINMNECCLPCHGGEQFSACDVQEESMQLLLSLEIVGEITALDMPDEALNNYIGCDWFEMHDDPGCPKYRVDFNFFEYEKDLADTCCYCQCHDFINWIDDFGDSCTWYEENESASCPAYGDYPNYYYTNINVIQFTSK